MNNQDLSKNYDAYYYACGCGPPYHRTEAWLNFFAGIADWIARDIQPKTVLDAGCAMGFLVEGFRNKDIDAWGVDISEYAIQQVHQDIKPYCWVASIADPFPQKYDLIVTIEVFEHLPPRMAEKAIENICNFTDDIIFSSTPFDYKEATHYNVQPIEYWAELFAKQGFYRDIDYDASYVTTWATRFRRMGDPVTRRIRDYERKTWQLWKENTDLRQLIGEMRNELAEKTQSIETMQNRIESMQNQIESMQNQYVQTEQINVALQAETEKLKSRFYETNDQLAIYENSKSILFLNSLLDFRRRWLKRNR